MSLYKETIQKIKPVSDELDEQIQLHLDSLTKPQGSLGRLEELAKNLCRIRGKILSPGLKKGIIVFAADHGVVSSGVSAFPQEVTGQMLTNFISGGAAINVLARHAGARVLVVDVGVNQTSTPDGVVSRKIGMGTANMEQMAAMTLEEAEASLDAGINSFNDLNQNGEIDVVGLGEMGIGNTTSATAILAAFTGAGVASIAGCGTGLTEEGKIHKIKVIETALEKHKPNPERPLEILSKVGGFEIGAIAGAILAASSRRIPVFLDGLIATAAALVAVKLAPDTAGYLVASHCSEEPGHRKMLSLLDLKPYFDLNMRLGEGSGTPLLMNLAEASLKILNEMATFDSAGVSEKNREPETV